MNMTDADYIKGFRDNDDRVIGQFYKKHRQAFFAFFKRTYSKDEAYIAELYQDSCVTLWHNVREGKLTEQRIGSALTTCLFSIGKRTMMSKDRKTGGCAEYQEPIGWKDLPEDDPDEALLRLELTDFAYRMVSSMKAPCNKSLIAQYWYRLPGAEIAKKLGYGSVDSVKSQKFKCIRKLRALVDKFKKLYEK